MPIDPRKDMCQCGHPRHYHGGLDGHGKCLVVRQRRFKDMKDGTTVTTYPGETCVCPQFTWSHIEP